MRHELPAAEVLEDWQHGNTGIDIHKHVMRAPLSTKICIYMDKNSKCMYNVPISNSCEGMF